MCDFTHISTYLVASCLPYSTTLAQQTITRTTTTSHSNTTPTTLHNKKKTKKRDKLFNLVRMRCWSAALKMLKDGNNSHQASYVNDEGYCALHFACLRYDTPMELVNALLSSFPSSPGLKDKKRGMTPLRLALEHTRDDIILALVTACPSAVYVRDGEGMSALYFAVKAEKSMPVIRAVLKHNPRAVNDALLRLYFGRWNMGLRYIFEKDVPDGPSTTAKLLMKMNVHHTISPRKVKQVYKRVELLITASSTNHDTTNITSHSLTPLLHSSISLSQCPWAVTHLILMADPSQAYQRDSRGNLPLHIALKMQPHTLSDANLYHCTSCQSLFNNAWSQHRQQQFKFCNVCVAKGGFKDWGYDQSEYVLVTSKKKKIHTIKSLLRVNPLAANVPDDATNKLPLQVASECGVDYDCVHELFKRSPCSLTTRDMETHMTVLMTAAASKNFGCPLEQFSVCFSWLMEDLSVVKNVAC